MIIIYSIIDFFYVGFYIIPTGLIVFQSSENEMLDPKYTYRYNARDQIIM